MICEILKKYLCIDDYIYFYSNFIDVDIINFILLVEILIFCSFYEIF